MTDPNPVTAPPVSAAPAGEGRVTMAPELSLNLLKRNVRAALGPHNDDEVGIVDLILSLRAKAETAPSPQQSREADIAETLRDVQRFVDNSFGPESREAVRTRAALAQREAVACNHEAYQGECMHCGVPIRNGRPVPAPTQPAAGDGIRGLILLNAAVIERAEAAEAERDALRAALEEARDWFESQAKAISKGCGSSWDLMQVREQRDKSEAALTAAARKETP